jgi:hypothetical protein
MKQPNTILDVNPSAQLLTAGISSGKKLVVVRVRGGGEGGGGVTTRTLIITLVATFDRLCGLVVRVSGYRFRGPGFDSRRFQIF